MNPTTNTPFVHYLEHHNSSPRIKFINVPKRYNKKREDNWQNQTKSNSVASFGV